MSIIHTPTEEERKKATDEMVDNLIKNIKKFADNEREDEGKEECPVLNDRLGKRAALAVFTSTELSSNEILSCCNWIFFSNA